jgi:ribosome maturation protein Sdo1
MNNMKLTEEQREQNKKEARSRLIDIILEKMMEEKLNERHC